VAHAVLKIEGTLDRHYLRRLESDARAPALGVVSGRLLDYMTHAGIERDRNTERPDDGLERQEIERMAERVRGLLAELTEEEREVVRLRFEEGWTAQQIAEERGLAGQRRVYTIIDRALRRLRQLLDRDG
jgi:RNA polymerase sigma factor (sigma-70 family)